MAFRGGQGRPLVRPHWIVADKDGVQIVVNHLTRMTAGYVCVAGLAGRVHIRPVLQNRRLTVDVLRERGGPFAVGAVVEIGETTPRPSAPEVEDHVFDFARARASEPITAVDFWGAMEACTSSTLMGIFGDSLGQDGRTASMPPGSGHASLGVLRPGARLSLHESFEKLRISVDDPDLGSLTLPVTDIRLYEPATGAIDERNVQLVQDRLRRRDVLLSVGLSRPWTRDPGRPRHWLQVNNVHLDDNPFWPN